MLNTNLRWSASPNADNSFHEPVVVNTVPSRARFRFPVPNPKKPTSVSDSVLGDFFRAINASGIIQIVP